MLVPKKVSFYPIISLGLERKEFAAVLYQFTFSWRCPGTKNDCFKASGKHANHLLANMLMASGKQANDLINSLMIFTSRRIMATSCQ